MKKKILHLDNSQGITGAYKALLSWCLATPEYEHVWVMPDYTTDAVKEELRRHFTLYTLPFVEIGRSPGRLLRYLPALRSNGRRLQQIIDVEQPQALHLNDLYNLTPYATRAISRKRLPLVVHARMLRRSFPGFIYDFWCRWHLRRADRLIAVSEAIHKDWGSPAAMPVIYDPLDIREQLPRYRFQKDAAEPFRFIYLANYIPGKGQDDALEAIRTCSAQDHLPFTVDFFGGTMGLEKNEAYKAALAAYVAEHRLEGIVRLYGAVTAVEATMKQYHALLHFSRSESFGMVCYEGLYYGLPVISSDCGGPAEMMEAGKTGLLLPVGDISGYAAAMQQLMHDTGYCSRLSEGSYQYIRAKFSKGDEGISRIFAGILT